MRINTGHGFVDMGPGSSRDGLTGHRSAYLIALEPASPTGMQQTTAGLRCPICGAAAPGGRVFCTTEHAKMGIGRR